MSKDIFRKLKKIWERLSDKEYREVYMEEVVFSDIAAQLYSIRDSRNWTQAELAEKVGIGQSKISKIESGDHNVSLKTLTKISNALDIALEVKFLSFGDFVHSTTLPRLEKAIVGFCDDSLPQIDAETGSRFERGSLSYVSYPTPLKLREIVHYAEDEPLLILNGMNNEKNAEEEKLRLNIEISTSGAIEEEGKYVH